MPTPCCNNRISGTAAGILPGALLILLPKCPLCLAAWLTAATGIGITAPGATWLRATLATLTILAAAQLVRRAVSRRAS